MGEHGAYGTLAIATTHPRTFNNSNHNVPNIYRSTRIEDDDGTDSEPKAVHARAYLRDSLEYH
ncbi:unnamed protein product [Arabidopsis thaliana]|uniref:Uncharacterized protein n=1 Tax=Arabidopsis thaliana TaxID=3702 RepID=A0A654E705_ARATH|nr:unnamed protein product [Arabidopsis thaliana]